MYNGLSHTIHKRLTEYTDLEDSQTDAVLHQLQIIFGPAITDDTADIYTDDDTKTEDAIETAYTNGFNEALDFARDLAAGTSAEQDVQDIYNELYKK